MVAAPSPGARVRRFGPFELDPATGELRKFGLRMALQDQPLQVLTVLLERPGELVTREELRQRLWPADTFVDFEHGLNAAVKRLRDALGDSADRPTFIETVPRRGYRFIAPVNGLQPAMAAGATVDGEEVSRPAVQPRRRVGALSSRVTRATLAVVAVTAAAVLVGQSVWPGKPHVSGYSRLVDQEVLFPPFPSEIPILTDGPRVYFTEWVNGRFFARQVPASGGEAVRLPLSLGDDHVVDSVSPDGSELLVVAFSPAAQSDRDFKYWIVPTAGGTPRRLGDVTGHSSHWPADAL